MLLKAVHLLPIFFLPIYYFSKLAKQYFLVHSNLFQATIQFQFFLKENTLIIRKGFKDFILLL